MSDLVIYERRGRVALLTLNRAEKRNALSPELIAALQASLARAEADPEVGAMVLTGAGNKAFCAGGDLGGGAAGGEGIVGMHDMRGCFATLLTSLTTLRKPIVGAAHAPALAGGFGLLMACDLVVVSRTARFGTPEIRRGLFPMMIVAVLLRTLGRRRTLELALTGREVDGETLERWGAATRCVGADDVLDAAMELATELATSSPVVMGLGRRAIYQAEEMGFTQALEYLQSQLTINILTDDASEGVRAFFEKRSPTWTGR